MSNNLQQDNENEEENDDQDSIHQTLEFRQTVCKAKKAFSAAAVALSTQSPSSSSPQREVITSFRDKLSCQNLKKELLLQQQQSQKQLEFTNEQHENSKQLTKADKQDTEHHIFINENPTNHRKTTALQDNMHANNRTFVGFSAARNLYQDHRHTISSPSQSPSSQDNKNNIHRFRQTLAMFKQQKYHEQQLKLQQQLQQWQDADNAAVTGNASGPLCHQEQHNKANQNGCNIDPLSLTQNIQKHEQIQQRNRGQAVGYLCKQNVVNRLVLKQTEKHRLAGRQRFSLELNNYTSSQSQLLEVQANSLLKPSQVISQRYCTPSNNQMENTSNIQSAIDQKILSQLNHSFYSGQAQNQQHNFPQYQDKNARKRSLSSSFSQHNSRRASGNGSGNQNNNTQLVTSQHQDVGDEKELQWKNNSYIPLKLFKRNDQRSEAIPKNASDINNSNDVDKQGSYEERIIVEGNCTDINTTCKGIVSSNMVENNRKLRCKEKENTSYNNSNSRRKTSQLTLDQHWERLFETPQKYSPADNHLISHQNLSEIPGMIAASLRAAETVMPPSNPRRITTAIEYNVETEGEGEKNSGRSGSTFGCKMPPKHIYNKNIQSKRCSTSAVSTEDSNMKYQYSGNDNKRRRKSSYQRTSNNGNQLFVDALGGFNQVQSPYQAYLRQITPTIAYLQSPQAQRHQFNSHASDSHNSIDNKLLIQNPFRKNSPGKSRILFTCKGEKYRRAASNSEQHKENAPIIKSITHGEIMISKTFNSHSNNHILIVNNQGNNVEVLPEVEGEQIKKISKIPQKGEDKINNGTETHDSQKINNRSGDDQKLRSTSPFRRSNFVELQFRDLQKEKSRIAVPSRSKQQSACEKRVRRMHDLIAESELQSQLQKQNKSFHNQLTSQNNSPSVLKWYINGTDSTSNSNTSSVYLDRYDDSQKRGVFQQSQDITASNNYKRGSSQSESRRLVKLVKYYNNKYGEKLINNGDKAAQLLESPILKASNTPLSRQARKHTSEICPWNSQQLLENDDGI